MKNIKIKFLLPLTLTIIIIVGVLGLILILNEMRLLNNDFTVLGQSTVNQIEQNMKLSDKVIPLAKSEINKNVERQLRLFQLLIEANPDMINNYRLERAVERLDTDELYDLVMNDPVVNKTLEELRDFTDFINVDEIHITNENGVLTYTNVYEIKGMIGFDFKDDKQAGIFTEALTNKDFVLIQEAQERGSDGKMFQYTGVARLDKPGVIQIGYNPEDLGKLIKNLSMQSFIENTVVADDGTIMITNKDGKIIAHSDKNQIDKIAGKELFYNPPSFSELTHTEYNDKPYLHYSKMVDDKIINVLIPKARYNSELNKSILTTGVGIAVITVLIVIISIIISNSIIIKPVIKIKDTLMDISKGDLRIHINTKSQDEIGKLSDSVDGLVNRFSDVITSVHNSITHFVSATSEIASGNQDLAQRTNEEASSLEETTASIDEISNIISDSTTHSKKLKQLMDNIKISMTDLEDSSKKMSEIIEVIEDITFRTNLLALNASIEAARAGESGKGFEVVAIEVKELSQQSSEQAKEIGQIVRESIKKIKENANYISEIVDVVDKITIANYNTNNQMSQITLAIEQLNDTTQQNASLVEESASASEEISIEAKKLNSLIKYFKVPAKIEGKSNNNKRETTKLKPKKENDNNDFIDTDF